MVAGHLCKADPVANHVRCVVFTGIAFFVPQGAAAPPDRTAANRADRILADGLIGIQVFSLMASLGSGHNRQSLFLCHFAHCDDFACADRIDGDRFFHEDMFAGVDGGLKVYRSEDWRSDQQHDIRIRLHHIFISIGPGHAKLFGDTEFLCGAFGPIHKKVCQSNDFRFDFAMLGCFQEVTECPLAAAAATD